MRLLLALLCSSALLLAQPQQSEHFQIAKSVLDAGGTATASANFLLVSSFGQPTPVGSQSSANVSLIAGFLSPQYLTPLLPIQRLVIKEAMPDVFLFWEPVSGAANYAVHRASVNNFVPVPLTQIGSASDTTFTDLNVLDSPNIFRYYKVIAIGQ